MQCEVPRPQENGEASLQERSEQFAFPGGQGWWAVLGLLSGGVGSWCLVSLLFRPKPQPSLNSPWGPGTQNGLNFILHHFTDGGVIYPWSPFI